MGKSISHRRQLRIDDIVRYILLHTPTRDIIAECARKYQIRGRQARNDIKIAKNQISALYGRDRAYWRSLLIQSHQLNYQHADTIADVRQRLAEKRLILAEIKNITEIEERVRGSFGVDIFVGFPQQSGAQTDRYRLPGAQGETIMVVPVDTTSEPADDDTDQIEQPEWIEDNE